MLAVGARIAELKIAEKSTTITVIILFKGVA